MYVAFSISFTEPITGARATGEVCKYCARIPDVWDAQEKLETKLKAVYGDSVEVTAFGRLNYK